MRPRHCNRGTWTLLALATFTLSAIHAPSGVPPTSAQAATGTIAFTRDNDQTGDEIWLIEPDGSNERRIWSANRADPDNIRELTDLDWRPDAVELAFASEHEQDCSIYEFDIYAIRNDGAGYRRITNGPACSATAGMAKGSVSVGVRNINTTGPLFVYVQGAPGLTTVLVPPGGTETVTVAEVADFGDGVLQQAVVIKGNSRWTAPVALADVKPGQTVHAGTLGVSEGSGIRNLGEQGPSWHRDGTRLGFIISGGAGMGQISATPPPGNTGAPLIQASGVLASVLDWGPTPALANQILYWIYVKDGMADGGIYQVAEGSADRGTELLDTGFQDQVIDVQWLPDGSGFVFTRGNGTHYANVFRYDLVGGGVTQLTRFSDAFAVDLSVSPDGQWIVFECSPTNQFTAGDLWTMRHDGTEHRLLVRNAQRPSWSQRALPVPPPPSVPQTPPALQRRSSIPFVMR